MKSDRDVSVIIVSFNTSELTLRCLRALSKTAWGTKTHETIVVDNASTDTTVDRIETSFPDVKIMQNAKNVGFAAGNNIGIRKAKGRYVLLLNSDTEVTPLTIPLMVDFMDAHPKAGVSTCKLMLSDGHMDPACHRGFPTPWASITYFLGLEKLFPKTKLFGQYHQGYKDLNVPHEIDCPSGAFFLIRREVIDQVGLLDEDYFMYGEDIDWAYRIQKTGWQMWFTPETSVIHYKKQSGRKHADQIIVKHANASFYETMKLFYQKHYEKTYPRLITQVVYFALDLRIIAMKFFEK